MDAQEVKPRQKLLSLRGRQFLLVAMGETDLLEWAEIQILCCRQKVEAAQRLRQGRESDLRECLVQLLCADVNLVARATGFDLGFAMQLTVEERLAVIQTQDELNGTLQLEPLMQGQAINAFVSTLAE